MKKGRSFQLMAQTYGVQKMREALAIAAKKGDPVAKQRAQNLVDRVNEVRGAQNANHKNRVSLDAYAPEKPNEPERKMAEPQKAAPQG